MSLQRRPGHQRKARQPPVSVKSVPCCQKCCKTFASFNKLVAHRSLCGVRKVVRCYACKEMFHSRDLLANHMSRCAHRRRQQQQLQLLRVCNICEFRTHDDKEFLRHIRNMHTVIKVQNDGGGEGGGGALNPSQAANERKATTIVVSIRKSLPAAVRRAAAAAAEKKPEEPLGCGKCGSKGFQSKELLRRHRTEAHDVCYCHLCHSPMDGTVRLRSHLAAKHNSEDLSLGSVVDVDSTGAAAGDVENRLDASSTSSPVQKTHPSSSVCPLCNAVYLGKRFSDHVRDSHGAPRWKKPLEVVHGNASAVPKGPLFHERLVAAPPEPDLLESRKKAAEALELAFAKVIPQSPNDATNCLVLPLNENSTAWEKHCI